MNRHHPYGGGFESATARRGGSPSGPGPDRSHRYPERGGPPTRGRGFGRGRGGSYGSFDGNMSQHDPYDQGHSQGDMPPYSNYEGQAPTQNSYYQNNYGAPPAAPASFAPPHAAAYNQDYVKIEARARVCVLIGPYWKFLNGAGPSFNDDGYGRGGGVRRPVRKERDDKVHDSIIEERIQRERPCRTLFIRNIKASYETNSDDVRAQFEEHGEIKTFFDLISTRGMVFVTYYDLRAAERARERLQGSEISGRPIDVHYSLPRDDHARGNDRDKNQQLQGTLQVTLRNSPSGAPLDDNEVRRKFQQFGDVKTVKPVGDRPDSRYVEFYDIRACEEAFDRLRHQGLQDGVMDIVLAWDTNEAPQGQPRDRGEWNEGFQGRGGRGRGRGGGGRGRGRGFEDDGDRRFGGNDYGRFNRGSAGRGRHDDDYGHRGGGRGGGYNDRYDRGGGYGDSGHPPAGNYGAPGGGYGAPPPPPPAPPAAAAPPDDRLEQARKVQQLLAALKQPQAGAAPPPGPPAPGIPPPQAGMAGMVPMQPPAPNYYGQPPMPPYPGAVPYGNMPPQSSTPQPGPPPAAPGAAPALSGLPPNILALLQSAQQPRPPPPPAQYGMGPPQMMNGSGLPPPPAGSNPAAHAQYQQLMSFLGCDAENCIGRPTMLVLSALHNLLSQVLSLPQLHTAVLLTPTGQLVSVASHPHRPKDEIRVVVGLAMEIWQETKEHDFSMVDSELGRILVVAVDEHPASQQQEKDQDAECEPLMLLALNSTTAVDWDVLQTKGKVLACHLAKPLGKFREYLAVPRPVLPASSTTTSPPPPRS
ncbi:hypothetical protein D9615_001162 [Tricholomella constricta]|uniref:RRM domain-containing protein n=1 Tax=Tricholomella constricta TaxID=117010 RepID=A0A8H5M8Q4_9AGAR|nr:hypothetical protein D9615_001162 [Tricholomella constricta]